MDDFELIDVSDNVTSTKKKDKFMLGIYISLIILILLTIILYFFGYELFKPYIKVQVQYEKDKKRVYI